MSLDATKPHLAQPQFPVSYDWQDNRASQFKPRDVNDQDVRDLQAATFLRNDKNFLHLLRQCKEAGWYVAITLGKDTVNLAIYSPKQAHDPRTPRTSTSILYSRSSFVFVGKDQSMQFLNDREKIQDIVTAGGAILYAVRMLRKNEIEMLDGIERSSRAVNVEDALVAGAQPFTQPLSPTCEIDTFVEREAPTLED